MARTVSSRDALIAACMMHVEGFYSVKSPAWQHCNPGNIMQRLAITKQFVLRTYPTILDGFTALVDDIAANRGMQLGAFIAKYAPPNENDTRMYQQVVSSLTGLALTDAI